MDLNRTQRWPLILAASMVTGLALADPDPGPVASIAQPIAYIEARLRGPIDVVETAQARPKIAGDRSARVVLAGMDGGPDLVAHWKPVAPPGRGFNNEPRYVLAAYEFQKLFLDECEYVVPPVVLRAMSLDEHRRQRGEAEATLRGTQSALFLLAYWLNNVVNRDPWDPERFKAEPRYARHWGNLNILTHIIDHKDANIGNLLISRNADDPRIFSVDNDVAFLSKESDRGSDWSRMHADRLPADTLARLRAITPAQLDASLGVLAEFRNEDGVLIPVEPPGNNFSPHSGVRTSGTRIQFGLTSNETRALARRIEALLRQHDRGRIAAIESSAESRGATCEVAAAQ
jgi:hypothetical protein